MARDDRYATTVTEFDQTHGFFPATVEEHSEHADGHVLHTIDPDTDTDIVTFDNGEPARMGDLESQPL